MAPADWRSLIGGVELVATDLDGTLLRPDLSVSAHTVDTFAQARSAGLPVVFVTGRPPRWMAAAIEVTGHRGTGICANGAVTIDLGSGDVIESHPVPEQVLLEVVATLRAAIPEIGFALEWAGTGGRQFVYEQAYAPRWPVPEEALVADIAAMLEAPGVVKLLARVSGSGGEHQARNADAFLGEALHHVEHLVSVTHSNADDILIEMSARGVTKGTALEGYAASLGLGASAVAAAGDMPNDLPMIAWAGVGLAVEDAHPSMLELADAVLPSASDDGVAQLVDAVLATRS